MIRSLLLITLLIVIAGASSAKATTTAATVRGNLQISGTDSEIIFPDGSKQSTATLQGPIGPTGPQGPKGDSGADAQITLSAMCAAIAASGMEVPTYCTNPSKFSMEWLSGKTLYDVWYGMASYANGDPKPGSYAGVARMFFGPDGIGQVKGLVNDEVDASFDYNVSVDGRMYTGTDEGGGFLVVGGGTSKYIKTYHLNPPNGSFDNVDLFFFTEADARLYADGLNSAIPK